MLFTRVTTDTPVCVLTRIVPASNPCPICRRLALIHHLAPCSVPTGLPGASRPLYGIVMAGRGSTLSMAGYWLSDIERAEAGTYLSPRCRFPLTYFLPNSSIQE